MKTVLAVVLGLFTADATLAQAAALPAASSPVAEVSKANLLSFAPASIGSAILAVEFERVLVPQVSLALGGHVGGWGMTRGAPDLGAQLGARFYTEQSLRGFFLDVHGLLYRNKWGRDRTAPDVLGFGGGAQIGWAWLFGNQIQLALAIGMDALHAQKLNGEATNPCSPQLCWLEAISLGSSAISPLETRPTLRLSFGFAF